MNMISTHAVITSLDTQYIDKKVYCLDVCKGFNQFFQQAAEICQKLNMPPNCESSVDLFSSTLSSLKTFSLNAGNMKTYSSFYFVFFNTAELEIVNKTEIELL
uniref:Uncharacterized protein n=1 Tax=Glossina palpalis gambiensis TaxID=67801 RepID=A0A1B0AZ04_9MUSC